MRDDDALDLSAWEAPPSPDGIADAVIARMDGTVVGLAMPEEPPSRKRWLVIGASAVAAVSAAGAAARRWERGWSTPAGGFEARVAAPAPPRTSWPPGWKPSSPTPTGPRRSWKSAAGQV